jgi:hypothetical protein
MKLTGTYKGEELQVDFRAWGDRADYGSGTPTDIEITDVEINALTIAGHDLTHEQMRGLPTWLVSLIEGYAGEVEFER